MYILGINAYHGDVAAVLLRDGQLVAAVEEERLRRVKHVAGFPRDAIRMCLRMAGITGHEVEHVAVSRRPRAHLLRKVLFAARRRPNRKLIADRASNYRRVGSVGETVADALRLESGDRRPRLHQVEHHPAHLASAFFVSPYDEAAVCAIDGFGDFVSTSWGIGRGARLDVRHRTFFPHSLGILYLAITQHLGFSSFGDEFKVMGLAPYGRPDRVDAVRRLIRLEPGGAFSLDLSYFQHWNGRASMSWEDGAPVLGRVFSPALEELLGPARDPEAPLEAEHEALAASVQVVFQDAMFHVLNGVAERSGSRTLCLAGGCAMNSVANGQIRDRTPFEHVYVQPASADNGTALGAAFWVWNQTLGRARGFVMDQAAWGPAFEADDIARAVDARRRELIGRQCEIRTFSTRQELNAWTARHLADGSIVGWFQGRMEWGARALGNRSILADPRRSDMRDVINSKIKFRERFRPFAPSVLAESFADYFEGGPADAFMAQVCPVRPERQAQIPAVTHVDGSARVQTVSREASPDFWALIGAFAELTGVPVLLNTSFNENEPIVHTPAEALDCFMRTRMDVIVLGTCAIVNGPNRPRA